MIFACIFTLLTPVCAHLGLRAGLIAIRFLTGLAEVHCHLFINVMSLYTLLRVTRRSKRFETSSVTCCELPRFSLFKSDVLYSCVLQLKLRHVSFHLTVSSSSRCIRVSLAVNFCIRSLAIWVVDRRVGYLASEFHDNSSTDISSTTLRLQTFRLLLYTSL